ncbi:MAG: hypothetical protein WC421_03150 [Elusimicrobiales bacterium]
MKKLIVCSLSGMMLCGSAFAGLESDKAGSGLKFRESAGSSRFSSRSDGGSGGVYIGGGSSSRSKSARRPSAAEISRSRTGSKKLAMGVPAMKTQQASANSASNESGSKPSIFSRAGAAVRNLASKAAKAATSPTGKKVALGVLAAAAAAAGIYGATKLYGKVAAGEAAQKGLAEMTKKFAQSQEMLAGRERESIVLNKAVDTLYKERNAAREAAAAAKESLAYAGRESRVYRNEVDRLYKLRNAAKVK